MRQKTAAQLAYDEFEAVIHTKENRKIKEKILANIAKDERLMADNELFHTQNYWRIMEKIELHPHFVQLEEKKIEKREKKIHKIMQENNINYAS